MIIDDKGKVFGKISIVDIIIVLLLIIAVAVGIFSHFNRKDNTQTVSSDINVSAAEQKKEIFIELELTDINEYVKNSASLNDKVYSTQTGEYLGEIVKINSKPHRKEITGTNGMMIFADVPQKYDITITVKISAKQTESGYYTMDNIHLICGEVLSIKTELLEMDSTVKKVSEKLSISETPSPQPTEESDKTN